MAEGGRDWTETEIILKARKKPLRSLEELTDACVPALTARLWATCCWSASMGKAWKIGDYNFLIASVSPDPQSSLYIQFWSEPLEPVLTEVCSGEWNPGAVRYVRQKQRKQIEALGYKVGGTAKNFGKEIAIRSSAQAEAAAGEVLAIFFNVFGYRGQWPLEVKCHQGERADLDTVYTSLTPEDLTKLAVHLGFAAEVAEGSDPVVLMTRGRRRFGAVLAARVPDNNLYSVVVFQTLIRSATVIDPSGFEALIDAIQFSQVTRKDERSVVLSLPVRLDGGVTFQWLANAFEHWLADWRACERQVKGTRNHSGEGARQRTTTSVH